MNPIVKVEGCLYINLGLIRNGEDVGSMSYDRDYSLYPYDSTLPDDLTINATKVKEYSLRGTKNLVEVQKDRIPYERYGYSMIDGEELIMLRRKYPERVVQPTK